MEACHLLIEYARLAEFDKRSPTSTPTDAKFVSDLMRSLMRRLSIDASIDPEYPALTTSYASTWSNDSRVMTAEEILGMGNAFGAVCIRKGYLPKGYLLPYGQYVN